MRKRRTAAAILGATALVAIPVSATAQVSATTSATFSGAQPERDGAGEVYCGGGWNPCASGAPAQVSWGLFGSGKRSSLVFYPKDEARFGQDLSLGTLRHTNTVVGEYNGITAVHFQVDTRVRDGDRSVEFSAPLPMWLGGDTPAALTLARAASNKLTT